MSSLTNTWRINIIPSSRLSLPVRSVLMSSRAEIYERPHVLVVGSANQDLISYTDVVAQLGETVLGSSFDTSCGGKGANQAVAAASLELTPVTMVCKVGRDSFGSQILDNFRTFYFF